MSPRPTGDNGRLPFAPRERERFVVAIFHDGVSVQMESMGAHGQWQKISELWYTPLEFAILLKRWAERQHDLPKGR